MGRFRQFLTELSAHDISVSSFLDDNISKYQWIFIKLGMCTDNVEIPYYAGPKLQTAQFTGCWYI